MKKFQKLNLFVNLVTETFTSVNAVSFPILEVKICPVGATEKLTPHANSPHEPLPQPSPVNIDSSTVAVPMLDVS